MQLLIFWIESSQVSGFVHEAVRFVLDMYDISTSHSEFSVSDDYKVWFPSWLFYKIITDLPFKSNLKSWTCKLKIHSFGRTTNIFFGKIWHVYTFSPMDVLESFMASKLSFSFTVETMNVFVSLIYYYWPMCIRTTF